MPRSRYHSIAVLVLLGLATLTLQLSPYAYAHEGMASQTWLLSYYVGGQLQVEPDGSLSQWGSAKMFRLEEMNATEMNIMSIHNSTSILFLIQRAYDASVPFEKAGALVAFEGAAGNDTDLIWAWEATGGLSTTDAGVFASANLSGSELTIVFGRALNSSGSPFVSTPGTQYEGFVKIASWDNGQPASSVDLEELTHLNLELLPPIDLYPKAPIVYSAVLLIGAMLFVYAEFRRYGVSGD